MHRPRGWLFSKAHKGNDFAVYASHSKVATQQISKETVGHNRNYECADMHICLNMH